MFIILGILQLFLICKKSLNKLIPHVEPRVRSLWWKYCFILLCYIDFWVRKVCHFAYVVQDSCSFDKKSNLLWGILEVASTSVMASPSTNINHFSLKPFQLSVYMKLSLYKQYLEIPALPNSKETLLPGPTFFMCLVVSVSRIKYNRQYS